MIDRIASTDQAGERLDVVTAQWLPEVSRSHIKKLCDAGRITVNGRMVKPGCKLKSGDRVVIDFDMRELAAIPDVVLPVLYEDDDCMVIVKPAGMLTHSKGAFNPEATVATFLRRYVSGLTGDRGGIVHRLDRATSGVMICAKNPAALAWLQKQFAKRNVKKTYRAVTFGHLAQPSALIDMPIERNPKRPQTFRAGHNGKPAQTLYAIVARSSHYDALELTPHTGRTHQLRVHLSHIGHPIVGDELYGGPPADRLYLHALTLELTLPNHTRQQFTAPLPAAFTEILDHD